MKLLRHIVFAVCLATIGLVLVFAVRSALDSAREQAAREETVSTALEPEPPESSPNRSIEILALSETRSAKRQWDLIDFVDAVDDTLTGEETAVILDQLRALAADPAAHRLSAVNLNSLLNLLRRNGVADPQVLPILAQLAANESADPEVRDYALQHTEGWLRERDAATGQQLIDDETARSAAHDLLLEAAGKPQRAFAGTAATSLVDLAEFYPDELGAEVVDETIRSLLESDETHPAAKISAIQLAGERRLPEALPEIRAVMQDTDASPALRLAAYGALGAVGQRSDLAVIDQLLASWSRDPRYDIALQTARERITARLGAQPE